MRRARPLWFLLLLFAVACGSTPDSSETTASSTVTTMAPTTSAAPTTSEAPTTTEQPTTSSTAAADPAPPELEGSWQTDLGFGDLVTLTLEGTTYEIFRGGGQGIGDIKVVGGTIVFSGSNICDGIGSYRWSIESGALTFTAIDLDPCKGRRDVLDGVIYTR